MALELKTSQDTTEISDAVLVADGDKTTVYTVRHLTIEKNREIVRKCTQKLPNRRTHQMDDVTDWEAVSDAQLDYVLVKWSGVTRNGQPLGVRDGVDVEDSATREMKQVPAYMLLDGARRTALLTKAGMNEVMAAPERRAESFRPVA